MAPNRNKGNGIAQLNILNIFNAILTLLFYFLVSRYTQSTILNSISIFFVSYSIYSVITAFSLNISTLTRISSRSENKYRDSLIFVRSAFLITTWLSVIPAIIISVVAYLFFSSESLITPIIIGILSGAISNYSRIFLVYRYSTLSRNASLLAFFLVFPLPRLISLVLFFPLNIHFGIEWGFLLGYIVSVGALFPRGLFQHEKEKFKISISKSFPLYILSLIGLGQEWLGTISIMVASGGSALLGRYYVFNALNIFLVSICTQIFLGLYPVLAQKGLHESTLESKDIGEKTDRLLSLVLLSFVMFVSAESPIISRVLFGSSTLFLDTTLVLLSLSTFFASFGGLYVNSYGFDTYFLINRKNWNSIYFIGGITLISFIISMPILVKIFGLVGVPIAFLLMNSISFILVRFSVIEQGRKYNPINLRLVFYSVLLFLAIWIFNQETNYLPIVWSVIFAIVVFSGTALALFFVIKPSNVKDVKEIYQLLTR